MGNYNFTGKKISRKLDNDIIQNGGLEIITLPIAKVTSNTRKKTEFGGYVSLINYNKDREQEYNDIKFQKKMRALRRNIKNKKFKKRGEGI